MSHPVLHAVTLTLRKSVENQHLSGLVWKASYMKVDGQKKGEGFEEMKGRLLRKGHNFQMTAIVLSPRGREKKLSIILPVFLKAIWIILTQRTVAVSQSSPPCRDWPCCMNTPHLYKVVISLFVFSRGAMMRMGTAPGAAWSSPPPTCMSWRVGSSLTTGPYLTKERSPWASVSLHPPVSPDTVRQHFCALKIVVFEDLHSTRCSPSA